MKRVGITMRVDIIEDYGERRDALDQRWHSFLAGCDIIGIPVPNNERSALAVLEFVDGVILSGGNDLACVGGKTIERDATEEALVDAALARRIPVLGVCRGMQLLATRFDCVLERIDSHAGRRHCVQGCDGTIRDVNSFHQFGITALGALMEPLARAEDGSIEAIRHVSRPVGGMMWHPEREDAPQRDDVTLFRRFFGVGA